LSRAWTGNFRRRRIEGNETRDEKYETRKLGAEDDGFWKDHKGAKVNAIRTRSMIKKSDMVIVRFGDKYKQWNAAFQPRVRRRLGQAGHHHS
jgi:YtoQ family protein